MNNEMAARLRVAADALHRAAQHCAAAAKLVDTGEVEPMAARMLAARGDILIATGDLDAVALIHADQSQP